MSDVQEERMRLRLPSDAQVFYVWGNQPSTEFGGSLTGDFAGLQVFVLFEVAPGVQVTYRVDANAEGWQNHPSAQNVSATDPAWAGRGAIYAGSAAELVTVSDTFGSYGEFWNSIVGQVMGFNNPAREDPEVLRVLAQFAARPDMSEAELQNRLQATQWYQGRTQRELEWNSASEQQREMLRQEAASRIVDGIWQFAGRRAGMDDEVVRYYLEDVASGRMGVGALNQALREYGRGYSDSPVNREDRDEAAAQQQRPIAIENTMGNVRDLLKRWGIRWSDGEIRNWATQLVDSLKSDEELRNVLMDQAQMLYAWKPREMETVTAAQPWLSTFERTMERNADLFDPRVQEALTSGRRVWEFEQDLRRTDEWLGTKNGQGTMTETIAEVGRRMGFV
jgi:hypothetical protein